jgi:hypothetical protein
MVRSKRAPKEVKPSVAVKKLRQTMKGKYWKGEYGSKALENLFSYTTSAILNEEKFEIEKVYARSNKAVRFSRSEGEVGVKLKGGGYAILREGKIYTRTDYRNALRGLDVVLGGYNSRRFENLWDSLSEKEQAQLASKLRRIDWDRLWAEDYDPKTGLFTNELIEDQVTKYIQEIRPDFR